MILPYKTRRFFRGLGIAALILVLLLVIAWMIWLLWLDRYVVYTRDGALLDMELEAELPEGNVAIPPEDDDAVSIYFNEGDNTVDTNKEQTQLRGYYIDVTTLSNTASITTARERLNKLPEGTAVMIDVKSIKGEFYYQSQVPGAPMAPVDLLAAEDLMKQVIHGDYYAIARIPAFRDYQFGLNNVPCGILHKSKKGLWRDEFNCYWLDPSNTKVLNYIIEIVGELKSMGFDEVVLTDFRVPTSEILIYEKDRTEVISKAVEVLIANCSSDGYPLSFAISNSAFPLPDGKSRLYLEGVSASGVGATAAQAVITNPEVRLVFVTNTNDTRYDQYGVLRPLESADVLEQQEEQ
jgi:hypothetical protein